MIHAHMNGMKLKKIDKSTGGIIQNYLIVILVIHVTFFHVHY